MINRLAEIELRRNGLRMPVIAEPDVAEPSLS